MTMKWNKLGRVYCPEGDLAWRQTHAYLPTPYLIGEVIRVFCSFWDNQKVGRVGFVDVDARDPVRVMRVSDKPVLDIGLPGTFDDNGVSPCSIMERLPMRLTWNSWYEWDCPWMFQKCKRRGSL